MLNQFKLLPADSHQKSRILALSVLLASCGGGGGGSGSTPVTPNGPIASTLSFNLQNEFQTLIEAGFTKTYTISGTCTGSLGITKGAANIPATFEGQSAFSATETVVGSFSNCTPASSTATSTLYYSNSHYSPLGFNSVGVNYGVFLTVPTLPSSVTVGTTGIVGTENLYTDSTKTVPTGRTDISYAIEADTATTAIANFISQSYNLSGVLLVTEQDQYRMTANGALTPISLDLQYTNGNHLMGQ